MAGQERQMCRHCIDGQCNHPAVQRLMRFLEHMNSLGPDDLCDVSKFYGLYISMPDGVRSIKSTYMDRRFSPWRVKPEDIDTKCKSKIYESCNGYAALGLLGWLKSLGQ